MKKILKVIGIFIASVLLVIVLGISGFNMINHSEYKEIKEKYADILDEKLDLGIIHEKEEIEMAYRNFDIKLKDNVGVIKNKLDSLSFDARTFVKTNDIKTTISLPKRINLLNTAIVVDDIKTINEYDNYKPEKTNDNVKKEVKEIDKKASEAYDLIMNEVSSIFTINSKELVKFVEGIDFDKPLSNKQKSILKKLNKVVFSDKFLGDIEEKKEEIKKIVDNIKKEIKDFKKQEEEDEAIEKNGAYDFDSCMQIPTSNYYWDDTGQTTSCQPYESTETYPNPDYDSDYYIDLNETEDGLQQPEVEQSV